jgi:hypothetical protein
MSFCPWTWGCLNFFFVSTLHIISHFVPLVKGVSYKIFGMTFFFLGHPIFLISWRILALLASLHPRSMVDPPSDAFSFARLRFVMPQYWSRMLSVATGNTPLAIWDLNPRFAWLTAPNCCLPNFIIFCCISQFPWVVHFLFTQKFCETTINYTRFLQKVKSYNWNIANRAYNMRNKTL